MPSSDWRPAAQGALFAEFRAARPGNPVFCHQAFLEKLQDHRNDPIGKKSMLLLHRLLQDERRQFYRSTQGVNAGWRRSRLGGNQGNHFYAWWAPRGAPPVKGRDLFDGAPPGAIFVRDIRHHDDHSELKAQSLDEHYLPVTVREWLQEDYGPAPWTSAQVKFAGGRQRVRIVKGYPGSGKTTALWNAAERSGLRSVLFVTFSPDLAALAREHFDKFCPAEKRFHVVTYPRFIRDLLQADAPLEPLRQTRERFVARLAGLPPRALGPWANNKTALYDEIHAHLAGAALPVSVGRFGACREPRLTDRAYRDGREPVLGRSAVDALLDTLQTLKRRERGNLQERFFPELALAWKAALALLQGSGQALAGRQLLEFDCLAVDEVQDLTPIEALVLVQLAAVIEKHRGAPVSFLAAGDEAQTVRPTDFEWGWFHDFLHHRLQSPSEFQLGANLRSPRRIAELVNRVGDLYRVIHKGERPSGLAPAEVDVEAGDQVTYCTAMPGPELNELLETLSAREGMAVICLSEKLPDYIPANLRPRIFTVFEAKGLDFHSVCILDPGKHLNSILHADDWLKRDHRVEPLNKRLMIDQLRVAMSRPAERLYWLEVSPSRSELEHSLQFLNGWRSEGAVSPVIPAAVLKSLEQEALPVEDRIRLCQEDARNYLEAKPAMAWARAKQAVALLGQWGQAAAVSDQTVVRSAHLTLSQISFCLAFRRVALPAELGRPDLYREAVDHAQHAGNGALAGLLVSIANLDRSPEDRASRLIYLARALFREQESIDPWLAVELQARSSAWMAEMEAACDDTKLLVELLPLMPSVYRVFRVLDSEQRHRRLLERAIQALMRAGRFQDALVFLGKLPEPQPKLEAACYEGLGELAKAADMYQQLGDHHAAIRIYRSVPDLDKALELLTGAKDHPAADSLRWIRQMQQLAAQRPENFAKMVTPQEVRYLEEILEQSLGVKRKKRAPRKPAVPKARP
jgi:tetratricopeptide (TPR) repeat protein